MRPLVCFEIGLPRRTRRPCLGHHAENGSVEGRSELWLITGNTETLRRCKKCSANLTAYGDAEGDLTWARWDAAMLARDFAAPIRRLTAFHPRRCLRFLARRSPRATSKAAFGWGRGRMPEPRSSSRSRVLRWKPKQLLTQQRRASCPAWLALRLHGTGKWTPFEKVNERCN